jgi:hypothetical protein
MKRVYERAQERPCRSVHPHSSTFNFVTCSYEHMYINMDGLLILDHGCQVPSNVVPVPVQVEKAKRYFYILSHFYYFPKKYLGKMGSIWVN